MWHLHFFGGIRASLQERTIERFRTQKTAALLALLALRGARSREEICALLWPEAAPEAARNSLSAALSALRRDLGDEFVCADRQSVALASGSFQTDVSLFDEALKAGDFARAVEHYRGHLLPGFYEDPFPSLEREYQEKAHSVFYSRLEELEENGQSLESLELARRAAALFGDEERWFLGFMRAHYGLGDLDAALRAYEALGRFMRRNGETASESARLLAKEVRREKERKAATPTQVPTKTVPAAGITASPIVPPSETVVEEVVAHRNNLPTQWTRFFGRESERVLLGEWIRKDQRLITLSGAGGSGKTRLALETLRNLSSNWNGDIVFVPLASLEDPELILPAIRDALALAGTPDLSPLEHIERTLRGRRALLFLDNFEQLVEGGAARLQALRERLPQTTFLITSRILLQLPGEREFPVAPLPIPQRNTTAAQVRECASAALFCDRSGLALDAGNAEAVGALCRRLDGIPLALELAAARAKVLAPAQILERLQKHPDFLQSRELGIPARHKTLRATIEWSTDLLPPDLRQFWTRLSLFHGGWTLEAAEKIASVGICEEWETLDWLTLLRDCSLIFIEEREEGSRFRMLQTLREFGREQLQNSEAIERTYFDFYLELAQQAASAMQGPGQTAWLARLDAEQDNLRAALTYARDFEPERGLLLATALIDFWETRLNLDEGRGWIETFLRATSPEKTTPRKLVPVSPTAPPSTGTATNLNVRVRALSGAGRMASHSIELNESRVLVEQGLQAARQSGDANSFIYAVAAFARFAMTTGDTQTDLVQARQLAEEAAQLARRSNDNTLLLEALLSLVYLRMTANDLEGVRPLNLEAIALARGLKDEARLSRLLSNLAHLCYHEKKWDEANELLEESTPLARRLTSTWELLEALWTRSNVAREQGQLDIARATILEEWELCRDNPQLLWACDMNLLVIGYLRLREGDALGAVRLWGSEEKLREEAGFQMAPILRVDYTRYCEEARSHLGESRFQELWNTGRTLSPQQAVDAAFATENGTGLTATRARALSSAGRMAWYGGDLKEAESKLREGLEAARESGDMAVLANATRSSALGSTAFGDPAQARDLGRESVRLAREASDTTLLLNALMDLGFAEINASDFLASEVACLEAITLARREGNERALAMTLATLAIAYTYLHRYDDAIVLLTESEELSRHLGAGYELIVAMSLHGHIASIQGHHQQSRSLFREVLTAARESISDSWTLVNILLSVAYSFFRSGDVRGCTRIMGASEAFSQNIDYQLMPFMVPEQEYFREESRRALGNQEFNREWQLGRLLSSHQIIDFVLSQEDTAPEGVSPSEDTHLATRAHALSAASRLAWYDGDFEASRSLVQQALKTARQSGDVSGFVHAVAAFVRLSSVSGDVEGAIAEGRRLAEEAVSLSRNAENDSLLLESLIALSYATMIAYELRGLRAILDEAVALGRKLGDDFSLATALTSLGTLCYYQEQFAEARPFTDESLTIARRLNSPFLLFASRWCASNIAREQEDFETAQVAVVEILELCRDDSLRWMVSNALSTAGYLLIRRGDVEGGVQALGATQAQGEHINYKLVPSLRVDFERYRTLAREILGDATFDSAWQNGKAFNYLDAIDFVLARLETSTTQKPDPIIAARARALSGAGRLAWYASDLQKAGSLLEQGLNAARAIGDAEGIVYATRGLMRTTAVIGESTKARELASEAVALARSSGNTTLLIKSLLDHAFAEININQYAEALRLSSEAATLAREIGDEAALPLALNITAIALSHDNRATEALVPLRESEAIARRLGASWDLQIALVNQGDSLSVLGEHARAQEAFNEGLTLCHASLSESWTLANNWFGVACIFMRRGEVRDGAQLLGAAEAMRQRIGYEWMPLMRSDYEWMTSLAHRTLGEAGFAEMLQRGAVMTADEVFDFAVRPIESIKIIPLEAITPADADESLAVRSRALSGAGRLAWHSNDYNASRDLVNQGLETARASGNLSSFVYAVAAFVRFAMVTGDIEGIIPQARTLCEEAVERTRAAGDKSLLLEALTSLAYAYTIVSRFSAAHATNEEAIALARDLGDELRLLHSLNNQAAVYFHQGLYDFARPMAEESLARSRKLNSPWELIVALWTYSAVAREQGELEMADQSIIEAIELCRANPSYQWGTVHVLTTASYLFIRRGAIQNGVRLMGASQMLRQSFGYKPVPVLRPEYERFKSEALAALGQIEFDKAWREGRAMTTEAALGLALFRDEATFSRHADEALAARARALSGAGRLAWHDSDIQASRALIQEGLESARQSGDTASFVYAVAAFVRLALSSNDDEGTLTRSCELSAEAVERARPTGNKALLLDALTSLGYSTCNIGRFSEAYAANEEAIALARELGDNANLVRVLTLQGAVYYHQGMSAPARVLMEECVTLCRRLDSSWDLIAALWLLSGVLRQQGYLQESDAAISEVLEIRRADPSYRWSLTNMLMMASYLFIECGDLYHAICLMSASEAINKSLGYHPGYSLLPEYERYKSRARTELGEADFVQAWEEGSVLSSEAAIELALRRDETTFSFAPSQEATPPLSDEVLAARSRALSGAGRLAWHGSDLEKSRDLVHEGLEAARKAGDTASFVYAVAAYVRFAMVTGDIQGYIAQSRILSEEAVARSRREGNKSLLLDSLSSLGYSNSIVAQFREAYSANKEAIALARELGDETALARTLNSQAAVYFHQDMLAPARTLLEESSTISRRLNSTWDLIAAQWTLSGVLREQGHLEEAGTAISEVLEIYRNNPPFRSGVPSVLMTTSFLLVKQNNLQKAVCLMAASEAISEALGLHPVPILLTEYERYKAQVRAMLDEADYTQNWAIGSTLTIEAAIELALRR